MLAPKSLPGRCFHCAIRTYRQALQARRCKAQTATKRFQSNNRNGPAVNLRKIPSLRGTEREESRWRSQYEVVLRQRLAVLKEELQRAPLLDHLQKESDGDSNGKQDRQPRNFRTLWKSFSRALDPFSFDAIRGEGGSLRKEMERVYCTGGIPALDERIKYAFYHQVVGSRFTENDLQHQRILADLRYPAEWFPATRSIQRHVHLHVGPTNSGKTYHALQRLEKASSGVYAGPLRLLAHEVYTRMNAKGRPFMLITGEERRKALNEPLPGDPQMSACTVEMVPLNAAMEVCVIDEIQMIGNPERGWAWTQALLGVKAKEVHLCGEERTVPLIRELCASVGDKLEIHRYERLSPLKMADESLKGDLSNLRKGDCIVSFSIIGIHALRRQIEQKTGRKVATVYGSLPPETRAQQARLFNDPNNDYDFLVASDAVGMGLNLAIKRIIFETCSKYDGFQRKTLNVADIKQIAGRAGRYRTAAFNATAPPEKQDLAAAKGDSPIEVADPQNNNDRENLGLVTTLEDFDYPIIAAAMSAEPEPIKTAGIFPPAAILERFAAYFPPGTPFSYILLRLHELSQMHSRFHLCGLKSQLFVADLIEPIKGLSISDRNLICAAPCSHTDDMWKTLMPAYASCIANQTSGSILEIEEIPLEILEAEISPSREYLRDLERLHKAIVTYLWLSYRFAGVFRTRSLARHIKEMVEDRIEQVLGKFSFTEEQRRQVAAKREAHILRQMARIAEEQEGVTREGQGGMTNPSAKEALDDEVDEEFEDSPVTATADASNASSLDSQATLTAGGDNFSGVEDLQLDDPASSEMIEEDETAANSFTEWRRRQTRAGSKKDSEEHMTVPSETENPSAVQAHETQNEASDKSATHSTATTQVKEQQTTQKATAARSPDSDTNLTASTEYDGSNPTGRIKPEIESEHSAIPSLKAGSPHSGEPRESGARTGYVRQPAPHAQQYDGGAHFKQPPPRPSPPVDVRHSEAERGAESRA